MSIRDTMQKWVADNFGSKRNLLDHLVHSGRFRLGLLRHYEEIAWHRVARVVYVCHGNICRSPYAEVATRVRHGLPAASFGLHATTGSGPNTAADRIAASRGIDLTRHHATSLEDFDWRHDDLLLAMEPAQAEFLQVLAERAGKVAQISLLGLFADKVRPYIADPYGCGDAYFHTCFSVIDSAVATLAERCRKPPSTEAG